MAIPEIQVANLQMAVKWLQEKDLSIAELWQAYAVALEAWDRVARELELRGQLEDE
jgi:hypothetical protein